jgi:hypothetical protein
MKITINIPITFTLTVDAENEKDAVVKANYRIHEILQKEYPEIWSRWDIRNTEILREIEE